jgi:hypothetical protein
MRKIATAAVAGAILVVSGVVYATVSLPAGASAQEEGGTTSTTIQNEEGVRRGHHGLLSQALGELVDEGTLSQEQADAVLAKVEELKQEHREDFEARFGGAPLPRLERRFGFVGGLLEDGVITEEELSRFPRIFADPEGPFGQYLEDGQLTLDELRQAAEDLWEQRSELFQGLERHGRRPSGDA